MKFKTKPFPHQLTEFERAKDKKHWALNMDMGTGKTKVALDIVAYKHLQGKVDRVLIVAPSGVHAQWITEQIPEHCAVPYAAHLYTSKKTIKYLRSQDRFLYDCKAGEDFAFMAMNIEAFAKPTGLELAKKFLFTTRSDVAIIIDEASIIKTPDIKTVKNVKKLRETFISSVRITLTGTPASKGPVNLWSVYDFLDHGYMGCSYVAFRMMHTVVYKQRIKVKGRLVTINADINEQLFNKVKGAINYVSKGKNSELDDYDIDNIKRKFGISTANFWHIYNSKVFSKYKNIPQLIRKIAPITSMVNKADCLELPPKIYEQHYFDLNPEQKKLIHQLQQYAVAEYQGEALTLEVKALLGLRILQICGGFFSHHTDMEGKFDVKPIKGKNAKLEYLRHDLGEVGNQQSIIWAVYTPEIDLLCTELSKTHSVARLDGQVKDDKRAEIVDRFKAGEIQHLVSQPEVGGFGYNFQNATVQYWYSRNYRTEKRIQAEDRMYRIGTVKSPVIKDLLYDIPFEKEVFKTVNEEKEINDMFISGTVKDLFKLK